MHPHVTIHDIVVGTWLHPSRDDGRSRYSASVRVRVHARVRRGEFVASTGARPGGPTRPRDRERAILNSARIIHIQLSRNGIFRMYKQMRFLF